MRAATSNIRSLTETIKSRPASLIRGVKVDDRKGDAAAYLNVKTNFTVRDALSAGQRLDSVLLESYMKSSHGFQLLAGFRDLGADTSLSGDRLSQLLDVTQRTFEHI